MAIGDIQEKAAKASHLMKSGRKEKNWVFEHDLLQYALVE
jgi:hypothetical protein